MKIPKHFYYITHIDNLNSILKKGILSRNHFKRNILVKLKFKKEPIFIDDKEIIQRRKNKTFKNRSLWDYANLYFQARNPMLYRVIREFGVENIIVLQISSDIINNNDIGITDGNAAASETKFFEDIHIGLNALDSTQFEKSYWNDSDKRKLMAEVLVYNHIPNNKITGIYTATEEIANKIKKRITRFLDVISNNNIFFLPDYQKQLTSIQEIKVEEIFQFFIKHGKLISSDILKLLIKHKKKFLISDRSIKTIIPESFTKYKNYFPPEVLKFFTKYKKLFSSEGLQLFIKYRQLTKEKNIEKFQQLLTKSQYKSLFSLDHITLAKGDMFFSKMQTFTVSVNTVGIMGKGLASRAKYQFPDVYVHYQDLCRQRKLKMGVPFLYKREENLEKVLSEDTQSFMTENGSRWFLLFPTKNHWKENSPIEGIENGLQWLLSNYKDWKIESIALPSLGCGLGGLDWKDVGPLMCKYLAQMDIQSCIYLPIEKQIPPEQLEPQFLLN